MSPEQERWAEALAVERMHGDQASAHVAGRVRELALAGDESGVQRWLTIAIRLDQLNEQAVDIRH